MTGTVFSNSNSSSTLSPALDTFQTLGNLVMIEQRFASIATSMTTVLRQGNFLPGHSVMPREIINGTTWTCETYLHVRWVWLALPVCLVLLTLILLVLTVCSSRQFDMAQWKSSTLPLVFNDLPYHGPGDLGTKTHPADMETTAKQMKVRLRKTNLGWRLSRKKGSDDVSARRARA